MCLVMYNVFEVSNLNVHLLGPMTGYGTSSFTYGCAKKMPWYKKQRNRQAFTELLVN